MIASSFNRHQDVLCLCIDNDTHSNLSTGFLWVCKGDCSYWLRCFSGRSSGRWELLEHIYRYTWTRQGSNRTGQEDGLQINKQTSRSTWIYSCPLSSLTDIICFHVVSFFAFSFLVYFSPFFFFFLVLVISYFYHFYFLFTASPSSIFFLFFSFLYFLRISFYVLLFFFSSIKERKQKEVFFLYNVIFL